MKHLLGFILICLLVIGCSSDSSNSSSTANSSGDTAVDTTDTAANATYSVDTYIKNIKAGKYQIRPRGEVQGRAVFKLTSSREPSQAEKPGEEGNGSRRGANNGSQQGNNGGGSQQGGGNNGGGSQQGDNDEVGPRHEGDVDEIWINIKEIQLVSDETGIVTISTTGGSYDLLQLKDDVTVLLGDAEIPQGFFEQMRLILDDPNGKVVKEGEEFTLKVPSGEQTGLKLTGDIDIITGLIMTFTLDFKMESLKYTRGQGYILTPVVTINTLETLLPFVPGYLVVKIQTKIDITYDENGTPITGISSLNALTVKHECISIENILSSLEFENLDQDLVSLIGMDRYYTFAFKENIDILLAMYDYLQDPIVETVSPDHIIESATTIPDDPIADRDRNLQSEQLTDINAYDGWDITTGSPDMTIAVVDTGVYGNHDDLGDRVAHGRSFFIERCENEKRKCVAFSTDQTPVGYHGTHVAGIIGATANNGIGIAGLNWQSHILSVNVFQEDEEGVVNCTGTVCATDQAIGAGIIEAVDRGAQVINMSFGGYGYGYCYPDNQKMESVFTKPSKCIFTHSYQQEATLYAHSKGVVLVAAAGNENRQVSGFMGSIDAQGHYPSSFPWVISVAALETGSTDRWENDDGRRGSNWGKVDISAPGTNIYSTFYTIDPMGNFTSLYDSWGGTSMAAPQVSALASLLLSVNPYATPNQVHELMCDTAVEAGPAVGYDNETGCGRINIFNTLNANITTFGSRVLVPGWFGNENQGAGSAIADINGNGQNDIIVFNIDNPYRAENSGYYRIGWDLDTDGNVTGGWSDTKQASGWFGAQNQGAGIAVGDINNDGMSDLLIFHIDDPGAQNYGYYRIGWNLDANGDVTGGWSTITQVPAWFGHENQGAGVTIADINNNGMLDMIIFQIDNPVGENSGYYQIGWDLGTDGEVTGGWTDRQQVTGWFGHENQGAGIAVTDINNNGMFDMIVFHIDNPGGENAGYYRIGWDLDTSGHVTGGWTDRQQVTGWFGHENQGAGIGIGIIFADINDDGRPDLAVFHLDNPDGANHGYYRIIWGL